MVPVAVVDSAGTFTGTERIAAPTNHNKSNLLGAKRDSAPGTILPARHVRPLRRLLAGVGMRPFRRMIPRRPREQAAVEGSSIDCVGVLGHDPRHPTS